MVRRYSISREKSDELYKKLPPQQGRPLFIALEERENRYKDRYYITPELSDKVVFATKDCYQSFKLVASSEQFYQELNKRLQLRGSSHQELLVGGFQQLQGLAHLVSKKKILPLEATVKDGKYILAKNLRDRSFVRLLAIASKNQEKYPYAAQLCQVVRDGKLVLGRGGSLRFNDETIGSYKVLRYKRGEDKLWVLEGVVLNQGFQIILGQVVKITEDTLQHVSNLLYKLSNYDIEDFESVTIYSPEYAKQLDYEVAIVGGEVEITQPEVALRQYLKATIKQYNLVSLAQEIKKCKVTHDGLYYQGTRLASYEIYTELSRDGEVQTYQVHLHMALEVTQDDLTLVIGEVTLDKDDVMGDLFIDEKAVFDYIEDYEEGYGDEEERDYQDALDEFGYYEEESTSEEEVDY